MEYLGYIQYFVIGIIVSLDVAALTLVRPETYFGTSKDRQKWALLNAFWHSVLLLLYGLIFSGLFKIAIPKVLQYLIDKFADMNAPNWVIVFLTELQNHGLYLLAIITTIVVWGVYKNKVIDNPIRGNISDFRQLKPIHALLKLVVNEKSVPAHAQALVVAVDMLAVAILLNSMNKLEPVENLIILTIIIFATVFTVCLVVSRSAFSYFSSLIQKAADGVGGKRQFDRSRGRRIRTLIIIMKLSEAVLIFYFLMEMITLVIWGKITASPALIIGSVIMVMGILNHVSLRKVIEISEEMYCDLLNQVSEGKKTND